MPIPTSLHKCFAILSPLTFLTLASSPSAYCAPTVSQALKFTTVQDGVDYDRPAKVAECTIKAEKQDGRTSWVVRNGSGQVLRRFSDTNSNSVVDQWSYFKNDLEVYRDVDANHNGKADQYRWFHTAGSRWGMDENEDGKIDSWKRISAEEVAAEVISALMTNDSGRFARLLLTKAELRSLGLGSEQAKELEAKLDAAVAKFKSLARKQKVATRNSRFLSFAGTQPGIVPAGTRGAEKDILVYENVAAMVQNGEQADQVLIGTLIRVGDLWRIVDIPEVSMDDSTAAVGYFFNPPLATGVDGQRSQAGGPTQKIQDLMAKLEKLDRQSAGAGPGSVAKLNEQRADLLEELAFESPDPSDRDQWMRQLADTVSVAVQSGTYDAGVQRLADLEKKLAENKQDEELLAYVVFRRMSADYNKKLQSPKADFVAVQAEWTGQLERFVTDHPKSSDTAEALLQLAIAQEFAGKDDEAIKWYSRIVSNFPVSSPAKKAAGAKRRIECVGKRMTLRGKTVRGKPIDLATYRGKTVLIQYWATWCEPCKTDMARIKELVAKYGKRGFEVIGVSLDNSRDVVASFLKSHRLPWQQIYEAGGLDSRLANEMGILTLPTMVLVDKKGTVINRGIHVTELDGELGRILR